MCGDRAHLHPPLAPRLGEGEPGAEGAVLGPLDAPCPSRPTRKDLAGISAWGRGMAPITCPRWAAVALSSIPPLIDSLGLVE